MAQATFAAGCFWGVEAVFQHLHGVLQTRAGYTGGNTTEPTYQQVCSGTTGHAEAVEIEYDPALITYGDLLTTFFSIHDPTEIDRQGPDVGSQYRSVIFYHTSEQMETARDHIAGLTSSGRCHRPIATRVEPAGTFWPAEDYHQSYFMKMGHRYGGKSCYD